jgi:hypothetical protein
MSRAASSGMYPQARAWLSEGARTLIRLRPSRKPNLTGTPQVRRLRPTDGVPQALSGWVPGDGAPTGTGALAYFGDIARSGSVRQGSPAGVSAIFAASRHSCRAAANREQTNFRLKNTGSVDIQVGRVRACRDAANLDPIAATRPSIAQ